ncbi:MAG: tetratricopeptide repeat protein [Acidobacteria bacterium]|nr:tetratricopeptide repeat protein [Acidobacteriota bacterium]
MDQTSGSGGGSRGNHSIRGKIFMPSGRLPELRMRVVLEVSSGGIYAETFSDSVGNFEFRSLPNNNYKIVVPSDGQTYDSVQENMEVSGAVPRTFSTQLYLREKERDTRNAQNKMISAAEFSQEVPKPAKKSFEQGVKKMKDGKNQEAATHFQEALKIYPEYLQALNKMGELQLSQQQVAEAESLFQQALKIAPKYPQTHINLGMLYVGNKRYPEAIEHLDAANNLDESFPMAHLNLGVALLEVTPQSEANLERAEREFIKALSLGGTQLAYVHKFLFNLHVRRRDYSKAASELEAYLKQVPNAPDAPQVQEMIAKVKKAAQTPASKP